MASQYLEELLLAMADDQDCPDDLDRETCETVLQQLYQPIIELA